MDDDEQEQEEKLQEKENVLETQVTKCTKPEAETKANISLPMTEAFDAWMEDFVAPPSDDEQEKEEQLEVEDIQKTESTKPASESTANINLPMTEASDAWMDDFVAPPSDDEQEKEEHLEEKEKALDIQNIESTKPASESTANINLPMVEASDAWMDDFVAPTSDYDDEQEQEEKLEAKVVDIQNIESTKSASQR